LINFATAIQYCHPERRNEGKGLGWHRDPSPPAQHDTGRRGEIIACSFLSSQMNSMEERLNNQMRSMEERLTAQTRELEYRLTVRLGSILVVSVGVMATLVKIL
jgi:hypothetical protein